MIPDAHQLEALGYDAHEREILDACRASTEKLPARERHQAVREVIQLLWPDERQRFQKTSIIIPKHGGPRWMEMNYAQERFWNNVIVHCRENRRPIRAIILKARQLGFSTMIQALHYFWCYENANRFALTVSYDEPSSIELFQKAKYINDVNMAPRAMTRSSSKTLAFASPHNSTFYVQTAGNPSAGRGITVQHLHFSEVPMWPNPDEVISAAHQAVPPTLETSIIWESTAKGAMGPFYERWQSAVENESFVPFFAPWHWDPKYVLPFRDDEERRAFKKGRKIKSLARFTAEDEKEQQREKLTDEQMKWRAWKIEEGFDGNRRIFQQEFPANATEAFLTSGSPVFDAARLMEIEHNCVQPLWRGNAIAVPS